MGKKLSERLVMSTLKEKLLSKSPKSWTYEGNRLSHNTYGIKVGSLEVELKSQDKTEEQFFHPVGEGAMYFDNGDGTYSKTERVGTEYVLTARYDGKTLSKTVGFRFCDRDQRHMQDYLWGYMKNREGKTSFPKTLIKQGGDLQKTLDTHWVFFLYAYVDEVVQEPIRQERERNWAQKKKKRKKREGAQRRAKEAKERKRLQGFMDGMEE